MLASSPLVAKKGIISGVEIGARRKTSGRLNRLETLDSDERASTSPSLDQLIGTTTNRLTDEAKAVLINLETVKCSEEIRAQWEAEYDRLVIRAKNLETQIRGVRDEARVIQNPLRDLQNCNERSRVLVTRGPNWVAFIVQSIHFLIDSKQILCVWTKRSKLT